MRTSGQLMGVLPLDLARNEAELGTFLQSYLLLFSIGVETTAYYVAGMDDMMTSRLCSITVWCSVSCHSWRLDI